MLRYLPLSLFILVTAFIGSFCLTEVASFDIFWQLASGKEILASKAFLYRDTFTLASDVFRWEHCWLHDVIVYLTYLCCGYDGLSFLKALLVLLCWVCLAVTARKQGAKWDLVVVWSAPLFFSTAWSWLDRPQLWTFALFAALLYMLEGSRSAGRPVPLAVAWILLVWENLHGGALLFFPIVGAYACADICQSFAERRQWKAALRRFCLLFGILILVSFLNPYGVVFLQKILLAAKADSSFSEAFQTTNLDWRATTYRAFPAYFYCLGATGLVLLFNLRRVALSHWLVLAGLAFMGWRMERHAPLFIFATLAIVPPYLEQFLDGAKKWQWHLGPVLRVVLVGVALVGLVWQGASLSVSRTPLSAGLKSGQYPDSAANFILQHRLPANLFNSYGWGGYLIWSLYPEHKVFWDGRQNSAPHYRDGMKIAYAREGAEGLLDQYHINTVVTESNSYYRGDLFPIVEWLRNDRGWALVFAESPALVFVRRSAVAADWLKKHALADERVDDVVLAMTTQLLQEGAWRSKAYLARAGVLLKRGEFEAARGDLENYLRRTPAERRNRQAVQTYNWLVNRKR